MGKFVGGLLIGLLLGAIFSESLFPQGVEGLGTSFQSWMEQTFGF